MSAASAQTPAASPNDKADTSMQQSTTQKTTPKVSTKRHVSMRNHKSRAATTGAGHEGSIGGPQNDPSIHQSIGRDSRGTPKGNGAQQ